jgi:hypothetical protein
MQLPFPMPYAGLFQSPGLPSHANNPVPPQLASLLSLAAGEVGLPRAGVLVVSIQVNIPMERRLRLTVPYNATAHDVYVEAGRALHLPSGTFSTLGTQINPASAGEDNDASRHRSRSPEDAWDARGKKTKRCKKTPFATSLDESKLASDLRLPDDARTAYVTHPLYNQPLFLYARCVYCRDSRIKGDVVARLSPIRTCGICESHRRLYEKHISLEIERNRARMARTVQHVPSQDLPRPADAGKLVRLARFEVDPATSAVDMVLAYTPLGSGGPIDFISGKVELQAWITYADQPGAIRTLDMMASKYYFGKEAFSIMRERYLLSEFYEQPVAFRGVNAVLIRKMHYGFDGAVRELESEMLHPWDLLALARPVTSSEPSLRLCTWMRLEAERLLRLGALSNATQAEELEQIEAVGGAFDAVPEAVLSQTLHALVMDANCAIQPSLLTRLLDVVDPCPCGVHQLELGITACASCFPATAGPAPSAHCALALCTECNTTTPCWRNLVAHRTPEAAEEWTCQHCLASVAL